MNKSRPAPFFVGEDRALDFLNTIAAPWGDEIEWLGNGIDLIDWLEKAELVSSDDAKFFRSSFNQQDLDRTAERARDFREWFRSFVKTNSGKPLKANAHKMLSPINEILASDEAYLQIQAPHSVQSKNHEFAATPNLHLSLVHRWRNPEMMLIPIAEAMGKFLSEKDLTLVRNCEGSGCTLWFHDTSKTHARRWCTMSVCGNRAKAAAHRARQR